MKLKFGLLQLGFLATLSVARAVCPDTFLPFNNECYKFDLPSQSWALARQACKASEPQWTTDLAVFDSQEEYDFAIKTIHDKYSETGSGFFIGVYADITTNKFTYVNGSTATSDPNSVPFLKWTTEPVFITPPDYMYPTYAISSGDWFIGAGSMPQRFICELTLLATGNCDTNNRWALGPDKMCHKINIMPTMANQAEARQSCKDMDADLVNIKDNATNFFIHNLWPFTGGFYPDVDVWTGGKARPEAGDPGYSWRWTDDTKYEYTDWSSDTESILKPGQDNLNNYCMTYKFHRNIVAKRWNKEQCEENFLDQTAHVWCMRTSVICLTGWDNVNKMCYFPVANKLTWNNADQFCRDMQGQLIRPKTTETLEYLRKTLKDISDEGTDYAWVGLSQSGTGGPWNWVGGDTSEQDFWVPGEDNKLMLNRGCAWMSARDANPYWTSTSCMDTAGFICEVQLGKPSNPPDEPFAPTKRCEVGWTMIGRDQCYLWRPLAREWSAARIDCKNLGGDMVQITTEDEQEAIMSQRITDARSVEYWIALQRENVDSNNYKWRDAAYGPLKITNWDDSTGQISKEGTCGTAYTADSGAKSGRWNMRNCATPRSYVCHKEASLSAFTTTKKPSEDNLKLCGGNGWEADPFSNYCYQFHEDADTTWHASQMNCETNGGNLVSINDPTELAVVASIISNTWRVTGIWTGLNLVFNSNTYSYTDGSPVVFINWNTGEPNTGTGNACTAMFANTGKWSLKPCTDKLGYVCKKLQTKAYSTTKAPTTAQIPPGQGLTCRSGYRMITGTTKCVTLYMKSLNYDNAKIACQSEGANLGTISNRDENDFFLSLFYGLKKDAWIGLENFLPNSQQMYFKWVDGKVPQYTNWMPWEPLNHQSSTERSDCVKFQGAYSGKWDDYWCSPVLDGFFCEHPAIVGAIVPTSAPSGCPKHSEIFPAAAFEHNCYYFGLNQEFSHYDAKQQCVSIGAQLTSILNQQEQTFLAVEMLNRGYDRQFYIGLSGNRDAMYWADNSRPTFYNFAPDVILTSSTVCATIGGGREYHGLWYTTTCSPKMPIICKALRTGWSVPTTMITTPQRDNTKCKDLFPKDPTVDAGDYCYVLRGSPTYLANTNQLTFSKASSSCRQLGVGGSALASIQNTTVNNIIVELAANVSYLKHTLWTGLSSASTESGFTWANGDPFYYNNFAPGQPASTDSVCVYIQQDGLWYTSDCFQYRNFVCLVPKPDYYANATTRPSFTVDFNASRTCGPGDSWALMNEQCYWLSSKTSKSWYDANSYCVSLNATLTSITDNVEQGYIESMVKAYVPTEYVWTGGNELDHESYKWVDGSPFNYNNWDAGQPSDNFGSQLCVSMRSSTGKWVDEDCTRAFAFVCKKWLKNAPAPPTTAPMAGNCPPNFHRFGYKCFMVDTRRTIDAESARNECARIDRGIFAASVLTMAEQQFLVSLMRGARKYVWIGLVNKREQGNYDYKWVSEEPFTFSNWGYGQPAGSASGPDGGKHCVVMRNETNQAGKWYEESCTAPMHYACSTYVNSRHSEPAEVCKPGFQRSGNSCWQISTSSADMPQWSDAIDRCVKSGSDLATIMDVHDQSYLNSQLVELGTSQMVWIGLHTQMNGVAYWQNGWPVRYTNWNYNQPVINDRYGCVAMNTSTGRWSTMECNRPLGYICRDSKTLNDTAPPPLPDDDIDVPGPCPGSADSWITIGSYCYYVNASLPLSFNSAVTQCLKLSTGTQIASIPSQRTHDILVQKIQAQQELNPKSNDVWIGYMQSGGSLEAVDGSPVNFVNWENGIVPTPGNNEPQCVYINGRSGYWLLQSCASSFGLVCRKPKPVGTSTTRKTTPAPVTHPTRSHQSFSFPDQPTTAPAADATVTIVLVVAGVLGFLLAALIIAACVLARKRPDMVPAWVVRVVVRSGASESLVGDKQSGVVNEVYESAQLGSSKAESAVGIEGPATSEGGTI